MADTVIVQVNKETPFVTGLTGAHHVSDVDWIVEKDHPLTELPEIPISEEDKKIGALIAERVPDGATIQLGIGGTSNAVGQHLKDKKDLGVHTEMLTESVMDLYELRRGHRARKRRFTPARSSPAFASARKKLYDFIDNNPICEFAPIYYTNNVNNIAQNDNMVSINNTMTVDLTGQCASESLGHSMYSGTGGQVDFVRGAGDVQGRHVVHGASLDVDDQERQDLAGRLRIPSRHDRDDPPLRRPLYRDRNGEWPTSGSKACPIAD